MLERMGIQAERSAQQDTIQTSSNGTGSNGKIRALEKYIGQMHEEGTLYVIVVFRAMISCCCTHCSSSRSSCRSWRYGRRPRSI